MADKSLTPFGLWLYQALEEAGLTVSEFLETTGIPSSSLYKQIRFDPELPVPDDPEPVFIEQVEAALASNSKRPLGMLLRYRWKSPADPRVEWLTARLLDLERILQGFQGMVPHSDFLTGVALCQEAGKKLKELSGESSACRDFWRFGVDIPWRVGLNQRFTHHGEQVQGLLGKPASFFIGKHFTVGLTKQSAQTARKLFETAYEKARRSGSWGGTIGSIVVEAETASPDASDATRWLEVHARWSVDEHGFPNGAVGISRDITLRAKLLRALGQAFGEGKGVLVVNAERRILMANPTFAAMLGSTVEELVGRDFIEITDERDRDASIGLFASLLKDGVRRRYVVAKSYVFNSGKKKGRAVPVTVDVFPLSEVPVPGVDLATVCLVTPA